MVKILIKSRFEKIKFRIFLLSHNEEKGQCFFFFFIYDQNASWFKYKIIEVIKELKKNTILIILYTVLDTSKYIMIFKINLIIIYRIKYDTPKYVVTRTGSEKNIWSKTFKIQWIYAFVVPQIDCSCSQIYGNHFLTIFS